MLKIPVHNPAESWRIAIFDHKRMAARSTAFSSSRTLPGQVCRRDASNRRLGKVHALTLVHLAMPARASSCWRSHDVFATPRKRRQSQFRSVKAINRIFREQALAARVSDPVRGCHQAHIDLGAIARAKPGRINLPCKRVTGVPAPRAASSPNSSRTALPPSPPRPAGSCRRRRK